MTKVISMMIALALVPMIGFARGMEFEPLVIYGDDDRQEVYKVESEAVRAIAASTVALIRKDNLVSTGAGTYNLQARTYGEAFNLCSDEPFFEQTAAASCSGFLVGPDLVATAGHCVNAMSCGTTYSYVFGYAKSTPGEENFQFPSENVYECKEVVAHELNQSGADYALIRLDRPVHNRAPLAVRTQGQISSGTPIFVIGHPSGLPAKVAGGAQVRNVGRTHFNSNLDTYGGNSGSAVFNMQTLEVEGILVRGATDFVSNGTCRRSNYCENTGCRGEDVTLISFIAEHLEPKRYSY